MVFNIDQAKKLAQHLLQIKAIKLSPQAPFTWASGWQSPIYCDNRKTLSYPEIRNYIRDTFKENIVDGFPSCEAISGVATAGIAHGALLADTLNMPFNYVRSKAKAHGLTNQIEGEIIEGQKVLVVEDLISTGGSAVKAVEALRQAGVDVIGVVAIFNYNFETAVENFKSINCPFNTLSDYNHLLEMAVEKKLIEEGHLATLNDWRQDPASWQVK